MKRTVKVTLSLTADVDPEHYGLKSDCTSQELAESVRQEFVDDYYSSHEAWADLATDNTDVQIAILS